MSHHKEPNDARKRIDNASEKLRKRGIQVHTTRRASVGWLAYDRRFIVRGPGICRNNVNLVELEELAEEALQQPTVLTRDEIAVRVDKARYWFDQDGIVVRQKTRVGDLVLFTVTGAHGDHDDVSLERLEQLAAETKERVKPRSTVTRKRGTVTTKRCDECGAVYAANQPGSTTATVNNDEKKDRCPDCS